MAQPILCNILQIREKLEAYYLEDAPRLCEEGIRLFGDKMLAFRTELEVLEEF